MKYSRKNGYYKYYNKEGKQCRVKFIENIENSRALFKLIYPNSEDPISMYITRKTFKDNFEILHHIVKNLETDGLVIEIIRNR